MVAATSGRAARRTYRLSRRAGARALRIVNKLRTHRELEPQLGAEAVAAAAEREGPRTVAPAANPAAAPIARKRGAGGAPKAKPRAPRRRKHKPDGG